MTAASHEPPHEASRGPAAREPDHDAPPRGERYGPLLLERYRKADGRPLLLYRRVADDG
jgi:hypothetical protein